MPMKFPSSQPTQRVAYANQVQCSYFLNTNCRNEIEAQWEFQFQLCKAFRYSKLKRVK